MTEARGQAIVLEYVLGIAVASILLVGLITASASFVEEQGEQASRAELRVIGQQVASDIEAADKLVVSSESNTTVRIERDLPTNVAGGYKIRLEERANPRLNLTSQSNDFTIEVEFSNMTAVSESVVSGGPILINYTGSETLRLERRDRS